MVYYLDPEFDPKKLTKSELRSIMSSHGVSKLPPISAKKEELLIVFEKEIIGKRNSILASLKNVKPQSDGIVFLDDSSRPSPKKPTKSRKKVIDTIVDEAKNLADRDSGRAEPIERPSTPTSVSTYRLVSRLENLEGNYKPKQIFKRDFRDSIVWRTFIVNLLLVPLLILVYFKFWFEWPVFTRSQLRQLDPKPLLYLNCPYENSAIGNCQNGKLYCSSGYIERRNLIWFGKTCVIDKERLSIIQSIKKKTLLELQNRLGMSLCYGQISGSISRSILQSMISNYFKNLKSKVFADYFDVCLRGLIQDAKIDVSKRDEEIYISAKEPVFSLYCRVKISFNKVLEERPVEIFFGLFFAFLATFWLVHFNIKRNQSNKINHYYLLICKILKEQSISHRSDPTVPSFISTNQLRDAVLIKNSPKEKAIIWPKVSAEVLKNSNIVESITIFRGEQARVWEWIGTDVSI